MRIFDAFHLSNRDFNEILAFLRAGGVIGFPTDTAYGLGADPFSEAAVRRIFEIKGRPESKPVLVLVDSLESLYEVVVVSEDARRLARQFWPGPLTMVLPALPKVPHFLTAGTGTLGVRWPKSEFANRLVRGFEGPITATSANKSGMPTTTQASEVMEQIGADLKMLIDGGPLPSAKGSTILDLTGPVPQVLRDGALPRDVLADALGNLQ